MHSLCQTLSTSMQLLQCNSSHTGSQWFCGFQYCNCYVFLTHQCTVYKVLNLANWRSYQRFAKFKILHAYQYVAHMDRQRVHLQIAKFKFANSSYFSKLMPTNISCYTVYNVCYMYMGEIMNWVFWFKGFGD